MLFFPGDRPGRTGLRGRKTLNYNGTGHGVQDYLPRWEAKMCRGHTASEITAQIPEILTTLNMTIPTYIDNSSILYAWNDLPCLSSVTVLNLHSDVICGSLAGKAASQLNSTYTPQVAS